MTDNQMREMVKGVYKDSSTWGSKVDKMTSAQVYAIYLRFRNQKRL